MTRIPEVPGAGTRAQPDDEEATRTMHPADHPRVRARATRGEGGFTLIELLVVITILGILAAVVVFSVGGVGDQGDKEAKAADARVLRTALEARCARAPETDLDEDGPGGYGTIRQLRDEGYLKGQRDRLRPDDQTAAGNMLVLGDEGTCGTGPKSSFTIYDPNAPIDIIADGLALGASIVDVAVNSKTNRVYVSALDGATGTNTVTVIDGTSDEIVDRIDVPGSSAYGDIVASAKTNKVYVSMASGYAMIDGADPRNADLERDVVPMNVDATVNHQADETTEQTLDPATGDLYVGVKGRSTIDIVDGGSNRVSTVSLPAGFTLTSGRARIDTTLKVAFFAGQKGGFKNQIAEVKLREPHDSRLIQLGPDGRAGAGPAGANQGEITAFSGIIPVASAGTAGKLYMGGTMKNPQNNVNIRGTYDLATGDFSTRLQTAIPGNPRFLNDPVLNPRTGMIYFQGAPQDPQPTNVYASAVWRLNTATGNFDKKGDTEANAQFRTDLVLNPNNNRVYVTQQLAVPGTPDPSRGGIVVVDGDAMRPTVVGQDRRFSKIAVNTNPGSNKVYAIDTTDQNAGKLMILR